MALSIVKREIEFALTKADEGLAAFCANPDDYQALLKTTFPHLHQVTGVLKMIGMEPVGKVTAEMERLVDAIGHDNLASGQEVAEKIRSTIKVINQYLDGLIKGEQDRPLVLFPAYRALLMAAGSSKVSEVDLFYPDISQSPPFGNGQDFKDDVDLSKAIAMKRTEFQKGIISLLRDTKYHTSLQGMHQSLSAINEMSTGERRVLWWVAIGYLKGLQISTTAPDIFQKQLCGRIDLQIKRQLEGTTTLPEGLVRELLLSIAYMAPVDASVVAIQENYRLKHLIPVLESAEATRVKLFINDIKEQVETAKDTWSGIAGGNKANMEQFVKQITHLRELVKNFGNDALQSIFAQLSKVAQHLATQGNMPDEALALETATGLLVIRDGLDSYPQISPDLGKLAETVNARMDAALNGKPIADNEAPRLIDNVWYARDKQLFIQLSQEMLVNLNQVEEVLDNFFRDTGKRSELPKLADVTIKQLKGVLTMLENDKALLILEKGLELVRKFAIETDAPKLEETELTAEAFSNLGLFIAALQNDHKNIDELLQPGLTRLGINPN